MKKMNKGAISIFALLSMMFFLIFIMVAYNNVLQKGKTQVETEQILVNYYKSVQSASAVISDKNGGNASSSVLKDSTQQGKLSESNKYIYSNGKIYKIP